ncbi:uncharacterized protein H6S33_010796 [Morchella sextelata]|uniref:uncharacterized protein n=1 Tax=Morchella sextelata TaxID=1174677 RepID=UPI001D03E479|nr:uncharacterized protein H6S33_010796 [Morchella sextelata]KAH0611531.1 hypothetical protein H6S33_010796 [Morchella sextelata]
MYRPTTPATPPATPEIINHFPNHVNSLKEEWAVYAQTHITDAAKQAEWIAPDQWREYLNEVFDYFGTGEPESNDNYPLRQYKNTTSFTADGFPIMTTTPLSEEDILEQLAKRQDFNSWKIRKALKIPSKHEKKAEQSQETTEAIFEYSQAVKTTIFTMGGKDLERFTALGMPGVPEGVHIKAFKCCENHDRFFVRPETAMHEKWCHNGQDNYQHQRYYERRR